MIKVQNLIDSFKLDENELLEKLCEYGKEFYVNEAIAAIADMEILKSIKYAKKFAVVADDVSIQEAAKVQCNILINDMNENIEDGLKLYALCYYMSVYPDTDVIPFDLWDDVEVKISESIQRLSEITNVIDNYEMELLTWE